MTKNEFSHFIEQKAFQNNTSCIEEIIHYCTDQKMSFTQVTKQINASLKAKLQQEYIDLEMMHTKSASLPH